MLTVVGFLAMAWAAGVAAAAGAEASGPAVWVIETEGESTWIMGTVHQLPDRRGGSRQSSLHFLPWWRGAVRTALKHSDIYVQEVVGAHTPAVAKAMERGQRSGDGERLRSYLDEQRYLRVEQALEQIGVSPTLLERAEPLAVLLVVAFASEPALAAGKMGVESWLERRARAHGKLIQGLETAEERITAVVWVLDRVDIQRQADIVADFTELLAREDRFDASFEEMFEAWQRGDMAAFEAGVIAYAELSPELHEAFLVARNRLWVGRVEELIGNRRNELLAVGIAHLAGPLNLIEMLRERGHMVRRIQ